MPRVLPLVVKQPKREAVAHLPPLQRLRMSATLHPLLTAKTGTVLPVILEAGWCSWLEDFATGWTIGGSNLGWDKRVLFSSKLPDRRWGLTRLPIRLVPGLK